jgi:hypothetical protein
MDRRVHLRGRRRLRALVVDAGEELRELDDGEAQNDRVRVLGLLLLLVFRFF